MHYIISLEINKMKNFVIAAILGLVTFSQVESAQAEFVGHKKRLAILNNLLQLEAGSDIRFEDHLNVQIRGDDYGEVPAYMDGADTAGGYKRNIPERFSEERDDLLWSLSSRNMPEKSRFRVSLPVL